ncbi:hypothetical protein HZC07_05990 [Candidatus Micrarchaeota archaeon]|nr:hypothetical protein [Candidatus Micrarchaeota archaeon]
MKENVKSLIVRVLFLFAILSFFTLFIGFVLSFFGVVEFRFDYFIILFVISFVLMGIYYLSYRLLLNTNERITMAMTDIWLNKNSQVLLVPNEKISIPATPCYIDGSSIGARDGARLSKLYGGYWVTVTNKRIIIPIGLWDSIQLSLWYPEIKQIPETFSGMAALSASFGGWSTKIKKIEYLQEKSGEGKIEGVKIEIDYPSLFQNPSAKIYHPKSKQIFERFTKARK